MTSATDELRRLLDERGVEWRGGLSTETMVEADGLDLLYVALPDGRVRAFIRNYLTPEQAVEATLGRGTCKWEPADFITEGEWWNTSCGESFTWEPDGTPRFCPNCGRKVVE